MTVGKLSQKGGLSRILRLLCLTLCKQTEKPGWNE